MTKIAGDVTELIGNTPLVKINKLFPGSKATILAKLEFYNPASSVKDRIAKSIIDAAEASGDLKPGGTIVEATSGNTGVGLALVGAARGYKVIITMPETMSKERRAIIRLLGTELVLTPGADGVPGANAKAAEIVKDTPGAILASQFDTRPTRRSITTAPARRSGTTPTARLTPSSPASALAAPSRVLASTSRRRTPRSRCSGPSLPSLRSSPRVRRPPTRSRDGGRASCRTTSTSPSSTRFCW